MTPLRFFNTRLGRGLALGAMVVTAGAIGWAASSPGTVWGALNPDRPGKVAPYTLLKPDQASQSTDQEIAFYQKRIQANPTGFLDLVALAEAYMRRGRATGDASWYLLAEQSANRSLANFSGDNAGAWMVLARVAIARHDFAEALTIVEKVGRAKPADPGVLASRATIHLAQGELTAAAKAADALAAKHPGTDTYTQRALVRTAQGRDDEAIADFNRAIELEQPGQLEGSAMARAWLARVHLRHGRLDVAEDLLREALRIVPEQPVALGLMAELELRRDRFDEAAKRFAQAYGRDPSPAFLLGGAQARAQQGRPEDAQALIEQAERQLRRDLASASFGHRRDLIRLLLERGRPADNAEALTLTTAELGVRRDGETLHLHAWALGRAGRYAEAAKTMQKALALGAREPEWLHRAAAVEVAMGHEDRAQALRNEAAKIDPNYAVHAAPLVAGPPATPSQPNN